MTAPSANAAPKVAAEFPPKLAFLFQPAPYKVAYGGRGSAKSWSFARALLILGTKKSLRVLCARELQNSIGESVHKLLSDQIWALGLQNFYVIEKARIYSAQNGTEFFFEGIKNNTNKIKSYEGIDICWVEEAQAVSDDSWEILLPTIRKTGSEIWISFNPVSAKDATYKRFVLNPPPGCITVKVNWRDNPWFADNMRQKMEYLKLTDYDAYLNVWEGHPKVNLVGAVFGKQLRTAMSENRIGRFPYNSNLPVYTIWDLGRSDMTAVWFVQREAFNFAVVDFMSGQFEDLDYYFTALQNKKYFYGMHYLPHDAKQLRLGMLASIEKRFKEHYPRQVKVIPRSAKKSAISAGREVFSRCYFDAAACEDGLEFLRNWKFEQLPGSNLFSENPKHDENSHAGDAWCQFGLIHKALGAEELPKLEELQAETRNKLGKFSKIRMAGTDGALGWMKGR